MKKSLCAFAVIGLLPVAFAAPAGERTVTFTVDNMSCAACPYIVKTSMAAVPGVTRVDVSFEQKTATVTFDDGRTTADAITAASDGAGYAARLTQ